MSWRDAEMQSGDRFGGFGGGMVVFVAESDFGGVFAALASVRGAAAAVVAGTDAGGTVVVAVVVVDKVAAAEVRTGGLATDSGDLLRMPRLNVDGVVR